MRRRGFFGMLVGALALAVVGVAGVMPVMAQSTQPMEGHGVIGAHRWQVQWDHHGKVWVAFPFKDIRKGMIYRIDDRIDTTTHAQSDAPYDEYETMGRARSRVKFLRLPTEYELRSWGITKALTVDHRSLPGRISNMALVAPPAWPLVGRPA